MWAAFRRGEWYADGGEVRAAVVRRLLLAPPPAEPGHLPRLRIRDVRITGRLDLAEAVVAGTLRLRNCRFEQAPCLDGAALGALELRDCVLPGLSGVGVTIGGKREITACRVEGPTDLYGASIGGTLHLENSRLTGHGERRGERALHLLCATVGGDIQAGSGFTVDGRTDLRDTSVRGSVVLTGAELRNPSGTALKANRGRLALRRARAALRAHGIDVGAEFNICDGFTALGRLSMSSITVRSRFCFKDGLIDAPAGQRPHRPALHRLRTRPALPGTRQRLGLPHPHPRHRTERNPGDLAQGSAHGRHGLRQPAAPTARPAEASAARPGPRGVHPAAVRTAGGHLPAARPRP
ncbi:hypothetical protein ACFQ51_38325 [Streptomyces kaempferi]